MSKQNRQTEAKQTGSLMQIQMFKNGDLNKMLPVKGICNLSCKLYPQSSFTTQVWDFLGSKVMPLLILGLGPAMEPSISNNSLFPGMIGEVETKLNLLKTINYFNQLPGQVHRLLHLL